MTVRYELRLQNVGDGPEDFLADRGVLRFTVEHRHLQEETSILKVPCITMRESTERPITVEVGSNQIVGTDPARIIETYRNVIGGDWREPQVPELWDGKAAARIAEILAEKL